MLGGLLGEIGQGQLTIVTAYVLVFAAVYLLALKLLQEEEARAAQENLEDVKGRKASSALVKLTRPFFSQYVVPIVRGKNYWNNYRIKFKRKLISSGLKDELTPDEFLAFKLFLILFFPMIGGLMNALDVLDLPVVAILGLTVVGWFYPDFWLNQRIQARHKKILRSMPFVVDLLALSTEAGLDFIGAIGKVVEKSPPSPLVEELEQVLKEIKVGSSRSEGLREMALRVNMPEINSFIAILISADQMGASIGKVLRQQSEQIRNQRFVMAEKAGALAAQKLIIPLVIFILPAVMLMVFGPFFLGFLSSGGIGG